MRLLAILLLAGVAVTAKAEPRSEVDCLASNIYFEARNQSTRGQIAVALVTLNRVKSSRFPNSVCEVVYQAKMSEWFRREHGREVPLRYQCQFSWYCDGLPEVIDDENSWIKIRLLSFILLSIEVEDFTNGSLFYHNNTVQPYWSASVQHTTTIGDHVFYR